MPRPQLDSSPSPPNRQSVSPITAPRAHDSCLEPYLITAPRCLQTEAEHPKCPEYRSPRVAILGDLWSKKRAANLTVPHNSCTLATTRLSIKARHPAFYGLHFICQENCEEARGFLENLILLLQCRQSLHCVSKHFFYRYLIFFQEPIKR